MALQMPATAVPPPQPAGSQGRGRVHSLESARRRRSRRISPGDLIRVLVVGGHALSRAGLRRLLEDDAGLTVIGEAASGNEAARLVRWTDSHVALVDAGAGEPDPAAATRALGGRVAVLLLTDFEADDRVMAALRAGATGVLRKDSHPAELASAVRTLASGGALLSPHVARQLIQELVNIPR